jgi:hypothetical protein
MYILNGGIKIRLFFVLVDNVLLISLLDILVSKPVIQCYAFSNMLIPLIFGLKLLFAVVTYILKAMCLLLVPDTLVVGLEKETTVSTSPATLVLGMIPLDMLGKFRRIREFAIAVRAMHLV